MRKVIQFSIWQISIWREGMPVIEWAVSDDEVGYIDAQKRMRARAGAIAEGRAGELVWLLEHPALYTAGTSAKGRDLLDPGLLPVFDAGRGGQYTYHGPGQRVAYVMLNLKHRGGDVRGLVADLERWVAATLAEIGRASCRERVYSSV